MMKLRNILQGGLLLAALLSLSLIPEGSLQRRVHAQNGNMQAANNKNKVAKKRSLGVVQPDLTIESVQVDTNDVNKLRIQIINKGNAYAKSCNLKIFYHRSGNVMVRGFVVSSIPKGETLWMLVDIGSPISAATKVTLRVDDPNRVRESNEGNNSYTYK